MLGAAFGIGFVIGPALGSLLSGIDVRAPFWGAAGLAVCNFLYGWFVLPESLPPVVGIPVLALWGLASPATQAMASRQVAANEQGRLQGALSGLASLGGIFAPFLFASIFAASIDPSASIHAPGAAYLLASVLVLIAGGVALRTTRSP